MKQYKTIDDLPKLAHRILGQDYEALGFFQNVVNEGLKAGLTEAESFSMAWKWLRKVYDKP
jgi:hypothetical protein